MAVLTWRNVDTPQWGNPISGVATAAGLLSKGTDGLSDAIGKFGTAQTTIANDAVAQAASRYQSADGLRQALEDGSLLSGLQSQGIDPTNVNAAQIAALQKGVGERVTDDLHTAQTTAAGLKGQYDAVRTGKTAYDLGVAQHQQSAMDAATPLLNEIALRRAQKDEAGAQALENDPTNRQLLRAVDPKTYGEISRGSLDAYGKTLSNTKEAFNNNVAVQTRQNSLDADALFQKALGMGGNNESVAQMLASSGANPQVIGAVQDRLAAQKNGWNLVAGPAGESSNGGVTFPSGSGGSGSGATGFDAVYGNGKYGQPDQPVSTMPIKDVLSFGDSTLIPNTKGKIGAKDSNGNDLGTSAAGFTQLTGQTIRTYAPQVLGADWQNQTFSPQVQDRITQAAWDDRKQSGVMSDMFPTLKGQPGADKPGGMKDVSWNQIRPLVAQRESATPAAALAATARPQTDVAGIPARAVDGQAGGQTNNAVPSLAALTQAAQDDSYVNALGAAGTAQRRGQQTAILGVPAKAYLDAASADIPSNNAAVDLLVGARPKEGTDPTGIAGALQGKDKNMVGRMLQKIVESPYGMTKDKDGNLAPMSYGQAALILAKGNNVLEPSSHPTLQKYNPASLSFDDSGQVFNQDAADNLLKSLTSNDVAAASGKQLRMDQSDAQVKDATTAVQTAQAKLKDLTVRMAKGLPVDDTAKSQMLAEYDRARVRLKAAQDKQNSAENQPLAVSDARAAVARDIQKKTANSVLAEQLLRSSTDPSQNPLIGAYGL